MAEQTAPKGTEEYNENPKEFTAITTQEDFDKAIQGRIARERAKYGDYDELKSKAAKYVELEEANKSEAQKKDEALTAALKRAEAAEQRNALIEAGSKAGIPPELMLGPGEDPAAYAAALKTWKGSQPEPNQQLGTPGAGKQPEHEDPASIDELINAAEKAGEPDLVATYKALKLGQNQPS